MGKERERIRRTAKKEEKKPRGHFKVYIFIMIVFILVAYRLASSDSYNVIFKRFLTKDTDYSLMFYEIGEVIKKHTVNSSAFDIPVSGKITSDFGKRQDPVSGDDSKHFGIDISAPLNSQITACGDGTVIKAEENSYYGSFVMLDHGNGLTSLYGHLTSYSVAVGDSVKKGEIIGLSGDSGRTTGPHLHFEVRKENEPVNPADYISYEN